MAAILTLHAAARMMAPCAIALALALWLGRALPGSVLAFTSDRDGNHEVYLLDVERGWFYRLTDNRALDCCPSFSPDGREIAFESSRDGSSDIYVMRAAGGAARRLVHGPGSNRNPAWSPLGQYIAFTHESFVAYFPAARIHLMQADTGSYWEVAADLLPGSPPAWSPDGTHIAFVAGYDGSSDIYVLDAGCFRQPPGCLSSRRRLTTDEAEDFSPAWSHDGSQIAFVSTRDGDAEIYVMDADGGVRQLTDNAVNDFQPAWSPDGAYIAFVSARDGNWEIYVMDSNGQNPRRLTDNSANDFTPVWQP